MIGHLDCSSGVSGDKFLGALLDAGRDSGDFTPDDLQEVVSAMVPGARVVVDVGASHGIAATFVRVETPADDSGRELGVIRDAISAASLPQQVTDRALKTFELIAMAEAKVHGCAPDDVHLHEVGSADSVMDVVGTCLGLHAMGIEQLTGTTVAVGGGTVETSHGILPVPAPATAELLAGIPTSPGPPLPAVAFGELTTPTGAALLRTCVDAFGPWPAMTPVRVGCGAGTRDIGSPNVCRLVIGEAPPLIDLAVEDISVLETNVDHLSGEAIGFAAEQLLLEGALDVWTSPALMKKGRPAYVLSVLVETTHAETTAARIVALTGTLGVRRLDAARYVADREIRRLDTPLGRVRFKVGPVGTRPEADDVAGIARTQRTSFDDVVERLSGESAPDNQPS